MKLKAGIALLFVVLTFAFNGKEKNTSWPKPIQLNDQDNETEKKVLLGRILFYDPLLSADNTVSCASCHSPYSAFAHTDHRLSHGIHDSTGTRNAPALMNLAWSKSFMWDGRAHNLDEQITFPLFHPAEMGETPAGLELKLNGSNFYRKLFSEAYGDTLITTERSIAAIRSFLLTLVSNNSRYDSIMRKQTVFSSQEYQGYRIFKKQCATCHKEPLFTTGEFANNGLKPDPILQDSGRMKVTEKATDLRLFKIPTLRNIEYTYPYMHDGRYKNLREVLNHYTDKIYSSATLDQRLAKKIKLNDHEKSDLVAFLLCLSDKNFIYNPAYAYPKNYLLQFADKP